MMYKQKTKELIESDEIYNNPVINLHPEECEAIWQVIVQSIRENEITTAMASFKTALGVGFKAGREDAKLDIFR